MSHLCESLVCVSLSPHTADQTPGCLFSVITVRFWRNACPCLWEISEHGATSHNFRGSIGAEFKMAYVIPIFKQQNFDIFCLFL